MYNRCKNLLSISANFHLLPWLLLVMQLCQDEVLEKWDNLLCHHFICNPITPSYRWGTESADMQKIGHLLEIGHEVSWSDQVKSNTGSLCPDVCVSVWVNGTTCHLVRLYLNHSNVTI